MEFNAPCRHCVHRDIGMLREHVLDLARKAVIQYAAASRLNNNSLCNTRSPGPVSAKAAPGHELTRPPKLCHVARR